MFNIKNLNKKNKDAVFLGCGPSINELNKEFLVGKDVWANNNFILHPEIIPDFYHLELKEHRNGPTFRKYIEKRKKEYLNTNWILNGNRRYLLDVISPEVFKNIFLYNNIKVYCEASVSIIFQIMMSLKYENIYVCGIDLYSCEYFWTYDDKINVPSIINTCKPDERKTNSLHPTQERNIAEFIKEINDTSSTNIINLSSKSILRNYIKSINV